MSEILQAVNRASRRSAGVVHEEMRAGLYGLATIACLAPWVGIFGTVWTFPNAFHGIDGQRELIDAYMFDHFGTSMWFTAFGLAIGLMSLWFYRYFTARLETFDIEMENATLDLLNQLSHFPTRFTSGHSIQRMFGEEPVEQLRRDKIFFRCCQCIAVAALLLASCIQFWLSWSLPWTSIYTPLSFGLSCLPAYPLWVTIHRRRPGGMVALASIICACWSIAELLMGRHLP